jgi:hypothetical protein
MKCHPEVDGLADEYELRPEDLTDESGCDFYDKKTPNLIEMIHFLNDRLSQECISLSQLHSKLKAVETSKGYINLINTLKDYIGITDMIREEIMKQIGDVK